MTTVSPAAGLFYQNGNGIATALWRFAHDVVTEFGATGNGLTDDWTAITAAIARATVDGFPIYFRPTVGGRTAVYNVSRELLLPAPLWMAGDGCSFGPGPILRATAPMRSVLAVHSTLGGVTGPDGSGSTACMLEGLTFDGNLLADYGVFNLGSELSNYRLIKAINSRCAGIRSPNSQLPAVLGAVTAGAGAPGGVVFSQSDPNYYGLTPDTPTTVVIRYASAGGLGVATFQASFDGGATFQSSVQVVRARVNVVVGNAGAVSKLSGFQVSFPAQNYPFHGTHTVTITPIALDFGGTEAAVASMNYYNVNTVSCGQVMATADQIAKYNGYQSTIVGGTLATTSGSQEIDGSGTALMSLRGAGNSRAVLNVQPGDKTYAGIVVDDVTFMVVPGTEPLATTSGLTYAVGTYGGYYEDGLLDGPISSWHDAVTNLCSIGFHFAGRLGPYMSRPLLTSAALAGIVPGDNATFGGTFVHPELDSGVHLDFLFYPGSQGVIVEPTFFNVDGAPLSWVVIFQGSIGGVAAPGTALQNVGGRTWLQNSILKLVPSQQTLTSAGQTLVLPDFTSNLNTAHTSYTQLNATGDFLLSGTPVLPNPSGAGLVWAFLNVSSHTLTWQSAILASTNTVTEAPYVTQGPGDLIAFISSVSTTLTWVQIAPVTRLYGFNAAGNDGIGSRRVVTPDNVTPTEIYKLDVANSGIAPVTLLEFSVIGQAGATFGSWIRCTAMWDSSANLIYFDSGVHKGSNAGGLPAGWALTTDPTGTSPFSRIYVTGGPATFKIRVHHVDAPS